MLKRYGVTYNVTQYAIYYLEDDGKPRRNANGERKRIYKVSTAT